MLVVGLGNPGPRYATTRHNVGFRVVEELARRQQTDFREAFQGRFARLDDRGLLLLMPTTFMNQSGLSVSAALSGCGLSASQLLVVHDELDLPFGVLRLKRGGGFAGHNGLRSIGEQLDGAGFDRLRVGIGRPPSGFDGPLVDFVLGTFAPAEAAALPGFVQRAAEAAELVAAEGMAAAMNQLNRRPRGAATQPDAAPAASQLLASPSSGEATGPGGDDE